MLAGGAGWGSVMDDTGDKSRSIPIPALCRPDLGPSRHLSRQAGVRSRERTGCNGP